MPQNLRSDASDTLGLNVKAVSRANSVNLRLADMTRSPDGQAMSKLEELTPKEKEVIGWMVKGKTNWEISKILNRSEATVKTHVQHIMVKLQTTSRTQTVALWASMRPTATSSDLQEHP